MRVLRGGIPAAALAASVSPAHADTMPQLDFANPLLVSQVVWGALIFAAFYLLLSRWGLPKVGAVLEMRAHRIGDDLEQARLAKETADHAVTELNAARRRAYAESQAAIAEASLSAKAESAARSAALAARLDAQLAESEGRIAASRAAAMGALRDVATETAEAVFHRLTGVAADTGRVRGAVGEILAERGLG